MMENCIFCKIAKEEIPCEKIWEDEKHLAFLDLNPNTEGMTLVITKDHFNSDINEMPEKEFSGLMLSVKRVAKMLEKGLNVKRVAIISEGLGVNHVHVKLFPIHGLADEFQITPIRERVFFDKYSGYISTQLGPEASAEKRKSVAEKILKNQ